jgi:hypothetical protein
MPLHADAGLMVIVSATEGGARSGIATSQQCGEGSVGVLVRRERVTLGPCNIAIRVYLQWSASWLPR